MAVAANSEACPNAPPPPRQSAPIFGDWGLHTRAQLAQNKGPSLALTFMTRFLRCRLAEERAVDPQARGFSLTSTRFPGLLRRFGSSAI
jgi:hypothetical protein